MTTHGRDNGAVNPVGAILRAVADAPEPMTAAKLRKCLPTVGRPGEAEISAALADLAERGRLHRWPPGAGGRKPRYWHRDWRQHARAKIVEVLQAAPLTRVQLVKAMRGPMFGVSESARRREMPALVRPLIEQGRVLQVPNVGRAGSKLSIRPPDAKPYFRKMLREFEAVCKKLQSAGLSRGQIGRAAAEVLGPDEPVADVGGQIVAKMVEIEPQAGRGALVSLRQLRRSLGMAKREFDRAMLDLAAAGRVYLHRHTAAGGLSEEQRSWLVDDGKGGMYVGADLCDPRPRPTGDVGTS